MDEREKLATARAALERYDEWVADRATLSTATIADLASVGRWYVESLDQADVTVGEC